MAKKQQRGFGGRKAQKSGTTFSFGKLLKGMLSGVKRFFAVKDSIWVAIPSILLFISFVLLATTVANMILREGEAKTLILGLIPTAFAVSAIKDLVVAFLRIKEDVLKRVITSWGQMTILIALLLANIVTGVGYSKVSDPCYGVTPVDRDKEILVLFAKFDQTDPNDFPVNEWADLIYGIEGIIRDQKISLIRLPETKKVASESDAKVQNACYGAIMTIWGTIGKITISANYTNNIVVLPRSKLQSTSEQSDPSEGIVDIPTFTRFIERGGDTKFMLAILAGELQFGKDNDAAIQLFTQAIKIANVNPWKIVSIEKLYYTRGLVYAAQGQPDKAIADYTDAIKLNPRYAAAYNNRGIAYSNQDLYDQAIADYTTAIQINSTNAIFYTNRGDAYENQGVFDKAIADYTDAIKLNPRYAAAYNNRGIAYYFGQHQYQQAIQDFTKAIQLNPTFRAYNNRGLAYYHTGLYEEAISDYIKAIKDQPKARDVYRNLANGYIRLERYSEALAVLQQYVLLNPSDQDALRIIDQLKAKVGVKP